LAARKKKPAKPKKAPKQKAKKTPKRKASPTAPPGFEAKLWEMADKQRAHMDAAEYKHVVLEGRLREALSRLNPTIPANALDESLRKATRPESPSRLANNRAFHQIPSSFDFDEALLHSGVESCLVR
jgi:hypothetical protein